MNQSVENEKVSIVLRHTSLTLLSGGIGLLMLASLAITSPTRDVASICIWTALGFLSFFIRYLHFCREKQMDSVALSQLATNAWRHMLFSGVYWGGWALLAIPTLTAPQQSAFVVVLLGLNLVGVTVASDAKCVAALFIPAWSMTAFALWRSTGSAIDVVAVVFVVFCMFVAGHIIQSNLTKYILVRIARDKALSEVQERNALQRSIFFGAAHDLRSPLHAIQCYLYELRHAESEDEVENLSHEIGSAMTQFAYLLDESTSFAKVSLGFQKPKIETVNASNLVEPWLAVPRVQATSKGLEFRVHVSDDCFFDTDVQILKRIVNNLVINAIRYTDAGGILVAFRKRSDHCSIEVYDTGVGIDPAEQERVFGEFYRVSRNDDGEGHGLGLTIVKSLSARLGYEISLSSKLGRGSVFRLRVPLAKTELPEQVIAKARTFPQINLENYTIILVDDDLAVLDSTAKVLERAGATVLLAPSLFAFRNLVKGLSMVDLVITDYNLQTALGTEVYMDTATLFPESECIFLTGDSSFTTQDKLENKGFRVLSKPTPPNDLLTVIADVLSLQPVASARSEPVVRLL